MTKEEVQKRVRQNGKPLPLNKFSWNEKTNTFTSDEDYLMLDFSDKDNCNFKTGSHCILITGNNCTFETGDKRFLATWDDCILETGDNCIVREKGTDRIIKIPVNTKIKLNGYKPLGYEIIE